MEHGLAETLAYLQTLGEGSHLGEGELVQGLVRSLLEDGYSLQEAQRNLSIEEGGVDISSVVLVALCVLMAGFASGLTQGLLSLDLMEMEIKSRSGTEEEKRYADKLIPIISRHHLLLVSLMLWNASATEALPIFLNRLVPEYLAIIISVTLVLFVGEIIPASILTGPRQLQITAALSPLVYVILALFFPVAYPISFCLDYIIGHDSGMTMYNRQEISTLMRLHREEGVKRQSEHVSHAGLNAMLDGIFEEDEVVIIDGALKYREMSVSEVMTPAECSFMIPVTEKLSYKTIYAIFKSGYSRIPVYERDRNDIVGLILAKDLIFVDPEDETPVRNFVDLFGRKPAVAWHDQKLGETLTMFKVEKSHMAIVRDVAYLGSDDPYYKVVGIITLEDIVEEILGTEIEDETDVVGNIEQGPMNPMHLRDAELARLKTIQTATVHEESLSEEEVHSIGIFLFTNVPQIQRLFKDSMQDLQTLIRSSVVISMVRRAEPGATPPHDDYLYRRGKMSNTCTLILSGTVEIIRDERDLLSTLKVVEDRKKGLMEEDSANTKGQWSTLAVEALTSPEGTYTPDFSAFITSEVVRFLRMTNVGKFKKSKVVPKKKAPGGGAGGEVRAASATPKLGESVIYKRSGSGLRSAGSAAGGASLLASFNRSYSNSRARATASPSPGPSPHEHTIEGGQGQSQALAQGQAQSQGGGQGQGQGQGQMGQGQMGQGGEERPRKHFEDAYIHPGAEQAQAQAQRAARFANRTKGSFSALRDSDRDAPPRTGSTSPTLESQGQGLGQGYSTANNGEMPSLGGQGMGGQGMGTGGQGGPRRVEEEEEGTRNPMMDMYVGRSEGRDRESREREGRASNAPLRGGRSGRSRDPRDRGGDREGSRDRGDEEDEERGMCMGMGCSYSSTHSLDDASLLADKGLGGRKAEIETGGSKRRGKK